MEQTTKFEAFLGGDKNHDRYSMILILQLQLYNFLIAPKIAKNHQKKVFGNFFGLFFF